MADMLGILITRNANLEHISGIVKAARKAGHAVRIFMTDEGVKFSQDTTFLDLLQVEGVELTVCEHSCEQIGVSGRTEGISYGSQYENATMLHDSARILVF